MMRDPEEEALDKILGDVDDMEGNKMLGGDKSKGVSITISVVPGSEGHEEPDADDYPEGHDISMCNGGCAIHKGYAKGGMVEGNAPTVLPAEAALEDKTLPPFLRKGKKKSAPSI